jgi:reactive intermediate/imine deaminase
MSKKTIGGMSAQGLPFSKAVRAGDTVYVSGQVAFDANGNLVEGGIEDQTRQTMRNLEAVLKEAGCKLEDVIKVNVWLDDARDFGRFNSTYAEFFPNDAPARSTVESRLMIDAKIEIDCIAYKPE